MARIGSGCHCDTPSRSMRRRTSFEHVSEVTTAVAGACALRAPKGCTSQHIAPGATVVTCGSIRTARKKRACSARGGVPPPVAGTTPCFALRAGKPLCGGVCRLLAGLCFGVACRMVGEGGAHLAPLLGRGGACLPDGAARADAPDSTSMNAPGLPGRRSRCLLQRRGHRSRVWQPRVPSRSLVSRGPKAQIRPACAIR